MATKNYLDKTGLTYFWSKIKAALPTKTSDLTNDSGFVSTSDTGTVSTTMLADDAVTSAKIDWSTINSYTGDFENILVRGNVNITRETNLNNIGTIFNSSYKDGYYAFNSYSGSSAGTGQPSDRMVGMMLVTSSSAWNVCSQAIYTSNAIYIRRYSDGAWGSWNKITDTPSNSTTYTSNGIQFIFQKCGKIVVVTGDGTINTTIPADTNYSVTISSDFTPSTVYRNNILLNEGGIILYLTISGTTLSYRLKTATSGTQYPRFSTTYISGN